MNDQENEQRLLEILEQANKEMARTGMISAQTLSKMNKAVAGNANAYKENTKAVDEKTEVIDKLTKGFISAAKDIGRSAGDIRSNREDFTSLNSSIELTGKAFSKASGVIGGALGGLGEAASGLGSMTKSLKGISAFAGGALKLLGDGVEKGGKAIAEMGVAFGQFATGELQNVVEAYRKVGAAGAIGAGGMTELYDTAVQTGLSLKQFSDIVARNSQSLAFAGGSTLEGTKALANLTESSRGFEDQMLKLGYSFEEQRDYAAKMLERNRVLGNIDINDRQRLSFANKQYLLQLDELSRLTGKSKDELAKKLADDTRNVRWQATLRMAESKYGLTASQTMQNVAEVIEARSSKEIADGLRETFANKGSEAAQKFALATGGMADQVIEDLKTGRISQEEAIFQIEESLKKRYASLGGDRWAQQVGKMGTAYEEVLPGLMKVSAGANDTVKSLTAAKDAQVEAMNSTDKTTEQTTDAQKALRDMGMELDRVVKDKVLPHAGTAIKGFTQALNKVVDLVQKELDIALEPATTQTPEQAAEQAKIVNKAQQDKEIYNSPEFKEWQKAQGAGKLSSGMYGKHGVDAYRQATGTTAPAPTPPASPTPAPMPPAPPTPVPPVEPVTPTPPAEPAIPPVIPAGRPGSPTWNLAEKAKAESKASIDKEKTLSPRDKAYQESITALEEQSKAAEKNMARAFKDRRVTQTISPAAGPSSVTPSTAAPSPASTGPGSKRSDDTLYIGPTSNGPSTDSRIGWVGGVAPQAVGAAAPGMSPVGGTNPSGILDMIGRLESGGDYNKLVGGQKANLTTMTIAQVMNMQSQMPGAGFASSAIGKYQFIKSTLAEQVAKLGLDPNTTKFDQSTQDQLAMSLLDQVGLRAYTSGRMSKEDFLHKMSRVWASLPTDPSGRGFYDKVGSNKSLIGWQDALASFADGGIASGPKDGYLSMMHGTEAVVPLPNGNQIPVEMSGVSEAVETQMAAMMDQVSRLDELVRLMKSGQDISTRLLKASTA